MGSAEQALIMAITKHKEKKKSRFVRNSLFVACRKFFFSLSFLVLRAAGLLCPSSGCVCVCVRVPSQQQALWQQSVFREAALQGVRAKVGQGSRVKSGGAGRAEQCQRWVSGKPIPEAAIALCRSLLNTHKYRRFAFLMTMA